MADQAKVTSIDALESFRTALIMFLTDARRSLDEVTDGVRRTRVWLEQEQRPYWEGQIRRRSKVLSAVEQELFAAKLSPLREATAQQEEAVRKARRALHEAEEKLRKVKTWNRNYESAFDPLTKRMEGLRHFLDHDMMKALAFLVQAQKTLEGYTELSLEAAEPPSPAEAPPEQQP
jgi:hypothetical protein